jgi:16S rRNA (cytosine967-C5)-methyltransferase
VPEGTQIALSIGLAQLAWLPGVADHAAVAESVELASDKKIGFPPHKGLVNAILRAASKDRALLASQLGSLPLESDRTPFAEQMLKAALQGQCTSENIEILWKKFQQPSSSAFAVLKGEPPTCLAPDPQFPQAFRLVTDAPFPTDWLRSGNGIVQDISSQALMKFKWPKESDRPKRILDLCAAPGGKTTALAHMWPNAKIVALEQNPPRAQKLKENLTARKIRAKVEVADSIAWLKRGGDCFDLILVDAPCSASGTIRKHPELCWIFKASDIGRLAKIQERMIDAAISRLAPGGLLIYSVCSWFAEEGLDHLARLERSYPQIAPAEIWPTGRGSGLTHIFRPDPLTWDGEGFQGFAVYSEINS